ncbi:uncharacterized protein V1513DRAFT_428178 [Lipomyces chichibuensis]|uniref:uncharacterized protein n=1 Tax=Lipomyces chichibuensis TaxID=1546026 RepID=UPI003343B443
MRILNCNLIAPNRIIVMSEFLDVFDPFDKASTDPAVSKPLLATLLQPEAELEFPSFNAETRSRSRSRDSRFSCLRVENLPALPISP